MTYSPSTLHQRSGRACATRHFTQPPAIGTPGELARCTAHPATTLVPQRFLLFTWHGFLLSRLAEPVEKCTSFSHPDQTTKQPQIELTRQHFVKISTSAGPSPERSVPIFFRHDNPPPTPTLGEFSLRLIGAPSSCPIRNAPAVISPMHWSPIEARSTWHLREATREHEKNQRRTPPAFEGPSMPRGAFVAGHATQGVESQAGIRRPVAIQRVSASKSSTRG